MKTFRGYHWACLVGFFAPLWGGSVVAQNMTDTLALVEVASKAPSELVVESVPWSVAKNGLIYIQKI